MVFSSIVFVFFFLPATYLLYSVVGKRFKNLVLLTASLIFYSWGEIKSLWVIALSFCVNYLAAVGMTKWERKKRLILIGDLVISLGLLMFFKYADFFISIINSVSGAGLRALKLTLPLGISFYTFQILSYTIDVYRGKVDADKNPINIALYLTMFPQLIAGPIVQYSDVDKELKSRTVTFSDITGGITVFITGLAAKVLLANRIGSLWDTISSVNTAALSSPAAWLGLGAAGLQLYYDFFGYSLMAIGLGKMFGFHFPKNFDFPFISKSVSEFWRRWHITLGSWFREYVYIPLGGNRKGLVRTVINTFIVWFLTGFWHGAGWNFIMWGLYFFVFISLEKWFMGKFLSRHKAIGFIYTTVIVLISWGIFSITDMSAMLEYFKAMFTPSWDPTVLYYLKNYGVVLALCLLFAHPFIPSKIKALMDRSDAAHIIIMLALFAVCIVFLSSESYNPFLYFRF